MTDLLPLMVDRVLSGHTVVFAYLDPGTGSYVLQLALAGILGAGYAVRSFWAQIKAMFSRAPQGASPPRQEPPARP
jgi:hypothetical protein